MRRFEKTELEQLKQAEQNFRTAVFSDYKRATTNKMDDLVSSIYSKAGGDPNFKRSCGYCSLQFYKKVGQKYFDDLAIVEKELEPKIISNSITDSYEKTDNNKATNKEEKDGLQNRGRKKKAQQ